MTDRLHKQLLTPPDHRRFLSDGFSMIRKAGPGIVPLMDELAWEFGGADGVNLLYPGMPRSPAVQTIASKIIREKLAGLGDRNNTLLEDVYWHLSSRLGDVLKQPIPVQFCGAKDAVAESTSEGYVVLQPTENSAARLQREKRQIYCQLGKISGLALKPDERPLTMCVVYCTPGVRTEVSSGIVSAIMQRLPLSVELQPYEYSPHLD